MNVDYLFVLTLTAGLEGYHVNVDGQHVTSFPYRTVSGSRLYMNGWGMQCNISIGALASVFGTYVSFCLLWCC